MSEVLVNRIYNVEVNGIQDSEKLIEGFNKTILKMDAAFVKAKARLQQKIETGASEAEIQKLNNAIVQLQTRLEKLSKQRDSSAKEALFQAKAEKELASAEAIRSKEMDRQISLQERKSKQDAKTSEDLRILKGNYYDLIQQQKVSLELYRLADPTSPLFESIKKGALDATRRVQEFNRTLSPDGTLVGEYKTGILNAFKDLGLTDIIKKQKDDITNQLEKIIAKNKELVVAYRKSAEVGGEAFSKIDAELKENIASQQKMEASLKQINTSLGQTNTIGYQITNGLSNGFKNLKKDIAQFVVSYIGFQAILTSATKIFDTTVSLDSLDQSLNKVSGSTSELSANEQFLASITNRLGLEYVSTATSFKNFYAAFTQAGGSTDQTRQIYESAAEAAATLKLKQDDLNGVFLAFGQIASKGTVQAEELRGQIGERIPGAFAIAARAVGVTQKELGKMLEQGQVMSADFLPKFAAELKKTFGNGGKETEGLTAGVNRLKNEFTDLIRDNQQGLTTFFSLLISIGGAFFGILSYAPALLSFLTLYALGWSITNSAKVLAFATTLKTNALLILENAYLGVATITTTAYNAALVIMTRSKQALTAATLLLSNAMRLMPLGLILTGVGLLVAVYKAFGSAVNGTTSALRAQAEVNMAANRIFADQTVELNKLYFAAIRQAESVKGNRDAIQKIIDQYPEYFGKLKAETATISQLKEGYDKLTLSIRESARAQASAKIASEKQAEANLVGGLIDTISNPLDGGNKSIDIKKLTTEERKVLLGVINNSDPDINGDFTINSGDNKSLLGVDYGGTKYNSKTILQRLKTELDKRTDIAKKYIEIATKEQETVDAKTQKAAEERKKNLEDRISRLDITGTEAQALISTLEKELATLKLNDPKRKELEAQIKKYKDLLNPKEPKGATADKLSAGEKNYFKDIDAKRDTSLAKLKLQSANGEIDEVGYLKKELELVQTAIKEKLAVLFKIKQLNAEESKVKAELELENITEAEEANKKLFDIKAKQNADSLDDFNRISKSKFNAINNDPNKSEFDKLAAKQQYLTDSKVAQELYNSSMDGLEKKYHQKSKDNAQKRSDDLTRINDDLNKNMLEKNEVLYKNMAENAIRAKYNDLRAPILGDKSKSETDRQVALDLLQKAENTELATLTLNKAIAKLVAARYRYSFALMAYEADRSKANEELLQAAFNEQTQAGSLANDAQQKLNTATNDSIKKPLSLQLRIGKLLGFGDENTEEGAKKYKLLGETISMAYNAAQNAMASYFDAERQNIENNLKMQERQLDAQKRIALNHADSAAERDSVERQFDIKRQALEKAAFERNKKMQIAQAEINLAMQLSAIAVAAAQNPLNGLTFFASGAFLYGIQAALALASFGMNVSRINTAQFAGGGLVEKMSNGKITNSPNIPTQSNGDNILATVRTGEVILNERQQRALGGPAVFGAIGVPGFPASSFKGLADFSLGDNLRAPINPSSFIGGRGSESDNIKNYLGKLMTKMDENNAALHSRVDTIKVQVVAKEVETTNNNLKKASSIATL